MAAKKEKYIGTVEGFTLLEVILVLVLISIFAAIAVSRQPSTEAKLKAQTDALKSHIRYAQMRAMNTDSNWGIGFGSNSYWLFKQVVQGESNSDQKKLLPGEDLSDVNLADQGIAVTTGSTNTLRFDTWGRPSDDSVLSIQLSKSGQSLTIAITPNTGFVP